MNQIRDGRESCNAPTAGGYPENDDGQSRGPVQEKPRDSDDAQQNTAEKTQDADIFAPFYRFRIHVKTQQLYVSELTIVDDFG